MSQITKRALAASLGKLLLQKQFDKITVIDITEACGVNRQTFYYHFKDIQDLLEWLFNDSIEQAVRDKKTYTTWQQGFLQILHTIQHHKTAILNVYKAMRYEKLVYYMQTVTTSFILSVVEEKAQYVALAEEDLRFITSFYAYAFSGIILDWIRRGMSQNPEQITENLSLLVKGDFTRAVEAFRTDTQGTP